MPKRQRRVGGSGQVGNRPTFHMGAMNSYMMSQEQADGLGLVM